MENYFEIEQARFSQLSHEGNIKKNFKQPAVCHFVKKHMKETLRTLVTIFKLCQQDLTAIVALVPLSNPNMKETQEISYLCKLEREDFKSVSAAVYNPIIS